MSKAFGPHLAFKGRDDIFGGLVLAMSNRSREVARRPMHLRSDEPDQAPNGGGIIIVALAAGLSGAIMGFLAAGYASFAAVALLAGLSGLIMGVLTTRQPPAANT